KRKRSRVISRRSPRKAWLPSSRRCSCPRPTRWTSSSISSAIRSARSGAARTIAKVSLRFSPSARPCSRVVEMAALPRTVTVGVVGAGAMGAGIAQVAAQAGHPVLLYDVVPGAANAAVAKTGSALGKLVERGKLAAAERDAVLDRLRAVETLEALAP